MRNFIKKENGYVVKFQKKYLQTSPAGMGGWSYDFVSLDKATIFSKGDALYYTKLNVFDEKNNNAVVTGTVLKVRRAIQTQVTTELDNET